MFDMSAMHQAKKKATENQEKRTGDYDKIFNEGIVLYHQFTATQNESKLKKAADKFFEAIFCKQNKMEPFLFLSMIFFVFDEEEKAKEYFETARELAPEKSEFMELMENVSEIIYRTAA